MKQKFNLEASKELLEICSTSKTPTSDVKRLLQQGGDPNYRPHQWADTPLMCAVFGHTPNLGKVRALLNAGADVMMRNGNGYIPLEIAYDYKVMDILLENNAKEQLEKRRPTGETQIMQAAAQQSAAVVAVMMKHGADPSVLTNQFQNPPLFWAVNRGDIEMFDTLMAYNPLQQIKFIERDTGYNVAMQAFHRVGHLRGLGEKEVVHVVDAVMHAGLDLKHKDKQGHDLLYHVETNPWGKKVTGKLKESFADAMEKQIISKSTGAIEKTIRKPMMVKKKAAE